ncbi:MAG TPA: hypothetical protein VIH35_02265, partial [Kiritimatiellia bacterium]
MQKNSMDGLGYLDDRAYVDLSVSRAILTERVYGVSRGDRIPMTEDVAWRYGMAGTCWLVGNPAAAPIVLAATCSVFALLSILRVARRLKASLDMILFTGLLLAVSPSFVLGTLDGTSISMVLLLATWAISLHIRALTPDRRPLPLLAAFCVGMASCIRIEFLLLWPVLVLHAVVQSLFHDRRSGSFSYTLLKGMGGLIIVAICLAPLIGWNMQVIRVPWPRVPGAPLTLDALSQPGAGAEAWTAISDAVGPAYAAVFNAPMVAAPWALILFVMGSIAILVATVRRREARAFAVLPLMVVAIPALLACLQPFLGNAS